MKLLVQEFLETKSIGELAKTHGVYCHFAKNPYKWSCSYDQIEARDADLLAQECRGLVLTTPDYKSFASEAKEINGRPNYDHIVPGETKILAYPFKRFFNHGQGAAIEIDFEDRDTIVSEKRDGTLAIVGYDFHKHDWFVATRSVPEADLPLDNFGDYTFRSLFDRAFRETMKESFISYAARSMDPETTYCFELTTPYNKVVCVYNDFRITLLGARSLRTMEEIDIDRILPDLPRVKTYSLRTPADIIKWVGDLNPLDESGEGVVVRGKLVNGSYERIKIKNPKHGLLSKAKDKLGSSMRNCLELALSGKEDDFVAVLPDEIVKKILDCKEGIRLLIKKTDEGYSRIVGSLGEQSSQKDFALAVQASGLWQPPMFKMRAGKVSGTREYIESCKKNGEWGSSFLDGLLELIEKGKPETSPEEGFGGMGLGAFCACIGC